MTTKDKIRIYFPSIVRFFKSLRRFTREIQLKLPFVIRYSKYVTQMSEKNDIFNRVNPKLLFQSPAHQNIANSKLPNSKKYIITDCKNLPKNILKTGQLVSSIEEIPKTNISNTLIYLYFTCDSDALPLLKKIQELGFKFIPHLGYTKTDYRFVNKKALDAIKKTWNKSDRVSHLDILVHENICEAIELTKNIPGDFVEIGVYKGGSALTAMNYTNELLQINNIMPRKAWLMDTFEGFNYEEAKNSSDIVWDETHELFGKEETKKFITRTLSETGVPFELIEGNICKDDLPDSIKQISVANIDVDMYEPTLSSLYKCAARLSEGGIIICEDPTATPALYGAYLAMNEFLESTQGKAFFPIFKKGQYYLIKNSIMN